jgi:branched-chain amino acid transport system permease protein
VLFRSGSIPGTVVAGLGLGLMEGVVATYVTSSLVNVFSFGVLILVLLLRPHGLVGVRVQET